MIRCRMVTGMTLAILSSMAHADVESVSVFGINAIWLRGPAGSALDGSGVNIGQVEPNPAAVRGFDSDANSNAFVIPFESRTKNGQSLGPNVDVGDGHALQVASVIIGADGDGDSDGADFLARQQNLGTGLPVVPANGAVPEPTAWLLAAVSLPLLLRRRAS